MPQPISHTHKYRRVKHPKRKDIWMCVDPNCSHRINAMYLDGKLALCFYCDAEFIVTREKLRKQGFLHCDECKRGGTGKVELAQTPSLAEIEKKLKGVL